MGAEKERKEEIEITPEMIDAVAIELAGFSDERDILEDVAERIVKKILSMHQRQCQP